MHRRLPTTIATLALALALVGTLLPATAAVAYEPDEPPPYHVRHFDLVDVPYDRLPWTSDPPPELPALPPSDRRGIRLFRWNDGRLYYRPGSVAINGMKRIDALRDTGDPAQLRQALVQARHLRRMAIEEDDAWWMPFWFDYPPEGLRAPWFNAMSQGLVLSFFVRLHRVTGDDVHLHAAGRVFDSFRRLATRASADGRPWVAFVADGGYLWLEHYPSSRPDHVLNAHLHALIGIYEYWQHTRDPQARQLLLGALTTMRDRAGIYRRRGRESLYGLHSRTNHFKYHQVHVWQLRLLTRMTGDPWFGELGDALAADRRPRRTVPGRPAEAGSEPIPNRSPQARRLGVYPLAGPTLDRLA